MRGGGSGDRFSASAGRGAEQAERPNADVGLSNRGIFSRRCTAGRSGDARARTEKSLPLAHYRLRVSFFHERHA